ncbi:uncharacterized protein BX663DRAFT_491688 [Cokeromyces recurvatus]|uniref:uncharacterized protein n=1 Tax=Cokeromyces recurvatus TaxID=90255 RepID=UPI0022200303|nr:uncharacterized protein BX663DRAFT_491688 [Cokeromyces recurvatus]KAI7907677.1 hypothetical protein BX663DRAFT_491688 [Cokeromyces recurvatus]
MSLAFNFKQVFPLKSRRLLKKSFIRVSVDILSELFLDNINYVFHAIFFYLFVEFWLNDCLCNSASMFNTFSFFLFFFPPQ